MEAFRQERADFFAYLVIWAAAQRGEKGIRDLRRHQVKEAGRLCPLSAAVHRS